MFLYHLASPSKARPKGRETTGGLPCQTHVGIFCDQSFSFSRIANPLSPRHQLPAGKGRPDLQCEGNSLMNTHCTNTHIQVRGQDSDSRLVHHDIKGHEIMVFLCYLVYHVTMSYCASTKTYLVSTPRGKPHAKKKNTSPTIRPLGLEIF